MQFQDSSISPMRNGDREAAGAHLDGVQAGLLHAGLCQHLRSLVPMLALYFALSFQTFSEELEHLRLPGMLLGALAMLCAAVVILALRAEGPQVVARTRWAEDICLVVRLVMHIVCIALDGDGTFLFLKLISMLVYPLSSAKVSNNVTSFRIYLFFHNVLVVLRFSYNLQEGLPWMITTVLMDWMLHDWAVLRSAQRRAFEELAFTHIDLEHSAEVTTKSLFCRFCDATVTLDADLAIAEPAPQLAALLGLNNCLQGRTFSSLIDASDLEPFAAYLEEMNLDLDDVEHEKPSLQVKLLDVFAQPVSVHIFYTCFRGRNKNRRPVYVLGVSESWRPPRIKSTKRGGSRLGTPPSLGDNIYREVSPPPPPSVEKLLAESSELLGSPARTLRRTNTGDKLQTTSSTMRTFSPRPAGAILAACGNK
mmetsp:Transcript_107505/g.342757  ORF Transcript_107505/g.342757 Transcript_107505/m.342757 type:complete len:422 (-) Transcript_107505:146-1411(-)